MDQTADPALPRLVGKFRVEVAGKGADPNRACDQVWTLGLEELVANTLQFLKIDDATAYAQRHALGSPQETRVLGRGRAVLEVVKAAAGGTATNGPLAERPRRGGAKDRKRLSQGFANSVLGHDDIDELDLAATERGAQKARPEFGHLRGGIRDEHAMLRRPLTAFE